MRWHLAAGHFVLLAPELVSKLLDGERGASALPARVVTASDSDESVRRTQQLWDVICDVDDGRVQLTPKSDTSEPPSGIHRLDDAPETTEQAS